MICHCIAATQSQKGCAPGVPIRKRQAVRIYRRQAYGTAGYGYMLSVHIRKTGDLNGKYSQ